MNLRIFIITAPIFLISCINEEHNNSKHFPNDKVDSVRKSLVGFWGGVNEYPPVWRITLDSIYYYDREKSYAYEIVDDDMFILYPESIGKLYNIFVEKDTIFFQDELGNKIRGYRSEIKEP